MEHSIDDFNAIRPPSSMNYLSPDVFERDVLKFTVSGQNLWIQV